MQSEPKVNKRPQRDKTTCGTHRPSTPRTLLCGPLFVLTACQWPRCGHTIMLDMAKRGGSCGREAGTRDTWWANRRTIQNTNCLPNIPHAWQVCLSRPFAHCKFVKQINMAWNTQEKVNKMFGNIKDIKWNPYMDLKTSFISIKPQSSLWLVLIRKCSEHPIIFWNIALLTYNRLPLQTCCIKQTRIF